LWPAASWAQRYATYLQRQIRTVPVRSEDCETRLGDRGLLRAHAGVTAPAAGVVGGARHPVPIVGRSGLQEFYEIIIDVFFSR